MVTSLCVGGAHSEVWHGMALCPCFGMAWCCTMQHGMALSARHGTAWHGTMCTAWYDVA